jgi:hypothetical protein
MNVEDSDVSDLDLVWGNERFSTGLLFLKHMWEVPGSNQGHETENPICIMLLYSPCSESSGHYRFLSYNFWCTTHISS